MAWIMNFNLFDQFSITCGLNLFYMRTTTHLFVIVAFAMFFFSCDSAQKLDVEALISELDTGAPNNTLTNSEEKLGWD